MANKLLQRMFCNWHSPVIVAGSFRPNGTGTIDNTLNTGADFTVVRTSQGVFTVTLANNMALNQIICMQASIQMASATDLVAQMGALDPAAAARTYVIRANAVATATDIADNAANRVHFLIVAKNSAVPK
jgi:hypothetical protein